MGALDIRAGRVGSLGTLAILGGAAALAWLVRDHLTTPYDAAFDRAGKAWNIPPNLLRAIARVESGFRPGALDPLDGNYPNGTRDVGLMQVNSGTFSRYGYTREEMLDPVKSITAGARALDQARTDLAHRFSVYTWPAAYNVGADLLPSARGQAYAASVVYHWQLYEFGRVFA